MRKIRILALLLAVLMIPFSLLVACKKDGEKDDECSVNGHDWNKKEVTIEKRTCTTSGVKERTCKVCKLVEQYEWKPEGHTIARAEWVYNEDALCTTDGTETRACALCTYTETRTKEGTALGHQYTRYALDDDGYSETAACDRCSTATDTRLVGINVDFEGAKNTMSYAAFTVYTAAGITDYYKTEGEGETFNSYLQIDRTTDIGIGDHGYGAVFAPGYQRLKSNKYVAEFDIKISKDNTGDLVLLQGNKDLASVDFLTYDAATHTISITYGTIYTLKDTDYDRWMKLSLVLNDIERKYEFYIDSKLVISGIDYENDDYFAGMDLESFKIGMTHEVGVASTFALDNIDVYIAISPKGFNGATLDPDYAVFQTTHSGNKIMYKKLASDCEHDLGEVCGVEADCYNDGYSYKMCSLCLGKTELATTDAKLNHMQDGVSTMVEDGHKDPTCTEYGAIYKKCTLCGYKDKESVAMLPHEIDTDAASYLNVPATCDADGYIKGECKVCHCDLQLFNNEYKFGHNYVDIEVIREANCVVDGYSEGKCINPGCGQVMTVDEVPALGHVMKTVIRDDDKLGKVFENFCLRCNVAEYTVVQALATPGVYPTLSDIQSTVGDGYYGGVDGSGFGNASFNTGTKLAEMRFTNDGSSSTAATAKEPGTNNVYLAIKHTATGYLNFIDNARKKGLDVVLEMSLRLPATGKSVTGYMTAGHRDAPGHNAVFRVFKLDENGNILFDPQGNNVNIGQLTKDEFTKIAFVFKQSTATIDVYIGGELKIQNYLMKKGETDFVLPGNGLLYEYRFMFDNVTSGERGLHVDDLFMYQASVPAYVTNPFVPNTAETSYKLLVNATSASGPYIPNATGLLGSKMQLSSNKNFRAYVEEVSGIGGAVVNALHCTKGDQVPSISGANNSKKDSELSTVNSLVNSVSAVLYNEIKFNDGSFTGEVMNEGKIVLAAGKKQASGMTHEETFLYVENGVIYAGDGRGLGSVKKGEWIAYNVVINEADFTYDIYINGICQASGVKFKNSGYAVAKYSALGYKFMTIDGGEFDFYLAGTALYAGAVAPVSDIEAATIDKIVIKTEIEQKFEAVKFYADQSTSVYYDYVGKIGLSGDQLSLVKLEDEALYAKKEAVTLTTLDGETVLRTTNYKTNNLKALEFKTLTNTKLATSELGVYDLSGYQYLSIRMNIEATTGYNVIIKLTSSAGGCYQFRYYALSNGWKDVIIPLQANTENADLPSFKSVGATSGDLTDVTSIRIEFEGGIAGNGNGKLMDGTTISFSKICFENDTIRKEVYLGENMDNGTFCENHGNNVVYDAPVAPTCTSKGYTKGKCSVCGYITIKDIKEPVKVSETMQGEAEVKSTQSCVSDGVKVGHFVCTVEGCEKDYYAVTEFNPAKDHTLDANNSCGDCGKELPTPPPAE